MIQIENAGFQTSSKTLLHPLTTQFERGKFYGLIGHNGSGKSTLLKLLAREYTPSQGTILLDNARVDTLSNRQYARKLAYLPQYTPVIPDMSARELVELGRYSWNSIWRNSNPENESAVARAIALTDTKAFMPALLDSLSGGERQRVWIAMLLAQNTPYILLDEPLAALDLKHQLEVMQLLQRLANQENQCVIAVIHDINLATRYCDRLLALRAGRLIYAEPPAALLDQQKLRHIYDVDLQLIGHPVHPGVQLAFN
ncbi:MAG: ABC transporter ATP-binding protein [Advenella sp.]